jgi:hypothetical protein
LKELLGKLIELQKRETEAEKIRSLQKTLPNRLNEMEEAFKVSCAAFEQKREEFEERQKLKREKDRQLQAAQEALKRTRQRLTEVKTNKEYQSMLKEIETSESKNGKLEEEIVALLEGLDSSAKDMKATDGEYEAFKQSHEEQKQTMQAEIESLSAKLDGFDGEIEELKQGLPPDIIRKYERIKRVGRGVAVVPVWKEVCYGCHMAIPPQMYNELQTANELFTCPNCNRIIFWEDRSS